MKALNILAVLFFVCTTNILLAQNNEKRFAESDTFFQELNNYKQSLKASNDTLPKDCVTHNYQLVTITTGIFSYRQNESSFNPKKLKKRVMSRCVSDSDSSSQSTLQAPLFPGLDPYTANEIQADNAKHEGAYGDLEFDSMEIIGDAYFIVTYRTITNLTRYRKYYYKKQD